jgi:hypothetical protein
LWKDGREIPSMIGNMNKSKNPMNKKKEENLEDPSKDPQ